MKNVTKWNVEMEQHAENKPELVPMPVQQQSCSSRIQKKTMTATYE